jgi:hypothetical protein
MVGRRTAAVTGLVALLLGGAALLGSLGAGATTQPDRPPGLDVMARVRDSYERVLDRVLDDDGQGKPDAPSSDGVGGTPIPGAVGSPPAPVTGQSSGEPSVGGAQATTNGADGNEAVSASTAPTPPNGAEPPAAASPGAADISTAAPTPADPPLDPATAAPAPLTPVPANGVLDDVGDVLGATGPKPVATGLSPDTTQPSVLVALLAFAVLLFLVGYQLVDRRDPRRDATRNAEAVARFR